ncbi:NAD-specific glutamate dehydrogenase [Pseudomonas sp. VLB120]|nr:NAD-specific glutamate dehydrogenase [Pseudomonas sp. VLB120]
MRQENHLWHRLLLDLIQVAPGQCGFDRRIKATGGKSIGHLRQTLGLLLDGRAIGAAKQITQFLHLMLDSHALITAEQTIAIGVEGALHRFKQALAVDLVLAQLSGLLVGTGVLEGILEHACDLAIGQAVGRFDLDAGFDARAEFAGGDAQQAIGVDLEGDADLRRTGDHGRDSTQLEARQGATVADQLALALQDVDHHRRLAIFVGGEFLGASHRDGGIARNHLFHQPAHGLKPKGQRDDVQQQQFATLATITGQGIGLDGSTDGYHLVRVDRGQRRTAEQCTDGVAHARNAGGTAYHDHGTDLVELNATITHGAAASLETAGDQWLDHGFECSAAQLALPGAVADTDHVGIGQGLLGSAGALQQLTLGGRVEVGGQAGLLDDPACNGMVEVIAAQGGIATGRQHLENTCGQAKYGDIEGTATQVIDGHQAFGFLVQAVGHRRGSGLVEQAQHVQAGQLGGVLGGLALGIVEVGRHGDHRPYQLATQGGFRSLAQHLEDVGGDFHRALRPLDRVDERHVRLAADEAVRQLLAQLLDVGQAAPHQALDRQHGVQWIAGGRLARCQADFATAIEVAHGGRQDDITLRIGQRLAATAAHGSDQRIGGTQVDTHRQATLVRLRALTGFGDLQ